MSSACVVHFSVYVPGLLGKEIDWREDRVLFDAWKGKYGIHEQANWS